MVSASRSDMMLCFAPWCPIEALRAVLLQTRIAATGNTSAGPHRAVMSLVVMTTATGALDADIGSIVGCVFLPRCSTDGYSRQHGI
eukprot:m.42124 g.42124  ORF g.42124 m.42124 type:complete len:86 (+) comp15009_c0_seq1:1993-2250(+)